MEEITEIKSSLPRFNLKPINDKCVDCDTNVGPRDRQELGWDKDEQPRRRCEGCINKRQRT